jgi:hypothetical protein
MTRYPKLGPGLPHFARVVGPKSPWGKRGVVPKPRSTTSPTPAVGDHSENSRRLFSQEPPNGFYEDAQLTYSYRNASMGSSRDALRTGK